MGPVKRPAPDALEETELFRKVLFAAFWGIQVVTDAISHGGLGEEFTVLFLAAKDFPIFWVFSNSPPLFGVSWLVTPCYTHLTGEGVCEWWPHLPFGGEGALGGWPPFNDRAGSLAALSDFCSNSYDHTYHTLHDTTWQTLGNSWQLVSFDFRWYCALWPTVYRCLRRHITHTFHFTYKAMTFLQPLLHSPKKTSYYRQVWFDTENNNDTPSCWGFVVRFIMFHITYLYFMYNVHYIISWLFTHFLRYFHIVYLLEIGPFGCWNVGRCMGSDMTDAWKKDSMESVWKEAGRFTDQRLFLLPHWLQLQSTARI